MINQRPCVNGVLAAVLSASFLPIHGALAKEPANHAKQVVKKPNKPAAHKPADAGKAAPESNGAGAGDKQ